MEDFLGLLFLALFFIVPKLLRQIKKKPQVPQPPSRTPPEGSLPPPFSRKETVVDDLLFEPLEKVERKRAPIQKKPVFKRKPRKKNLHTLLKELPSKKEIIILSEILKRPSP